MDCYDGGTGGENRAHVDRTKKNIKAEPGCGERQDYLLPSNANRGSPGRIAAGRKGEISESREASGDGAVTGQRGEASRRPKGRHASKDLVYVTA